MTKDFFNPKKVQKGPQMGENTILGWMLHQFMKNVVFSLLLIKIWSFQEAFLSLLKTFEFWQWNLKIKYLLWLYHCYICNIILQMIQIQWNLESFIDLIHETFMRGSDSWQFSHSSSEDKELNHLMPAESFMFHYYIWFPDIRITPKKNCPHFFNKPGQA